MREVSKNLLKNPVTTESKDENILISLGQRRPGRLSTVRQRRPVNDLY
jgi:hypothetical protein